MRSLVCAALIAQGASAEAQRPQELPILASYALGVAEPSDLCAVPGHADRFFVVSDNGFVAVVDTAGRSLRRSPLFAFDLEACAQRFGQWVVVDEGARQVRWLDSATFQPRRSFTVPYGGGRNKGFESITWLPDRDRWLLVTERDPILLLELDTAMQVANETELDGGVRDISSATWHDNALWLLSDMDRQVMRCDPSTFAITARFTLPVINPEGFVITPSGALWVSSDDRERLYRFQLPPTR